MNTKTENWIEYYEAIKEMQATCKHFARCNMPDGCFYCGDYEEQKEEGKGD